MPNFKNIFISLCLLSTFVYSEDVAKIADNEKFKYLVNTEDVIETTCQYMVCPQVKEGYVTRVKDVNIKNGETQCYVYEKGSNKVLGTVGNVNEKCMEEFSKTSNNKTTIFAENLKKFEDKKEQRSKGAYQSINEQKDLYFDKYINTGNQEYIDASKYMIAGLTLDNKIINVSESINKNHVILQSDYTLYANSINEEDKYGFFSDVAIFLGVDKDKVAKREKTDVALISETATTLSSMTPEMLSNVTVYIMHFMSEYNVQMLELKSFLLFTVVPFTLFFLLQSKLTKKLGEISDFDDAYERIFFTALTLFVFYFSTTTIKVDNASFKEDTKISQSNFQNWFRNIFYEGSEIATGVARAGTTAYLRYKTQDLGAISSSHLATLEIEYEMAVEERNKYLDKNGNGWLGECYKSFDTDKLKNDVGSINNLGMRFPSSEMVQVKDANAIINSSLNWYADGSYLKDGANPNLSVSGCYNFERRYLSLKSRIEELKNKDETKGEIINYARASKDETISKQLNILTQTQFKNSAELGWIAFSMLPTINIAINELEIINSPMGEMRKESVEAQKEAQKSSMGIGSEDISIWQASDDLILEKLSNIAYMMLPAADSIYKVFKDLGQGTLDILVNTVPYLMPLKFGLGGIAADATIAILALMITIAIMKFLIVVFPLIGIIMASTLAIAFYFFSVEIYYIISPFIIVFAMASQQGEVIKKFLKVGVTLAIKPIIIVISLVMAIWAYEFFKVFNDILVDWNFNSIFAVMHADGHQLFNTFFLTIAKQFIHIGLNIVAFIVVFYMVLNGANMIMDMFGLSDANVDMQSSVGSNIDNKSSKWNSGGMA